MIKRTNIKKDIIAGIIVALVSIPISMGYASIAGLPVVYGLYGSLIPIFIFALITSSPQFVVGVDAMPAVMVGGVLASMGIVGESKEALEIVPLMSIMVAIWFIIFYIIRAGRVVKYISTPVMGGFISGVGATIILYAIPAVKGVEFGNGFEGSDLKGSVNNDAFAFDSEGNLTLKTNHSGGIQGGISLGDVAPIVFDVAMKPTPSISKAQETVNLKEHENTTISIEGRHDPCVAPRAVPVVEAAAAIALYDMLLVSM